MPVHWERVRVLLPRFESGALPAAAAMVVQEHLDACTKCGGEWRARESLRTLVVASRPDAEETSLPRRRLRIGSAVVAFECDTSLGWFALCITDLGLAAILGVYPNRVSAREALVASAQSSSLAWQPLSGLGARVAAKLRRYFEGHLVLFDEPVDLRVLPVFHRHVLAITRNIRYGETRTYGWVAAQLGRPGAARAVGHALHANPLAPVVPCHRVVGASGSLTGYAGGLAMKRWLLELERRQAGLV